MDVIFKVPGCTVELQPKLNLTDSDVKEFSRNFAYALWAMPRSKYDAADLTLVRFENATVHGFTGFISVDQSVFSPSLTAVFKDDYKQQIEDRERNNIEVHKGTYASIFNWFHRNYWHWHLQCLPNIILLEMAELLDKVTLIVPRLNDWQRASLEAMGISSCQYIEISDSAHKFETLIHCSFACGHTDDLHPISTSIFKRIQNNLNVIPQGKTKIYLARFDSRLRLLLNEREVADALQSIGYDIVTPGAVSYSDQVRLLSQARIVVGSHGAGLTNCGFSACGALFELCPDTYFRVGFAVQASLLKQPYTFCSYAAVRNGKEHVSQMPNGMEWEIPTPDMLRRVIEFENACER